MLGGCGHLGAMRLLPFAAAIEEVCLVLKRHATRCTGRRHDVFGESFELALDLQRMDLVLSSVEQPGSEGRDVKLRDTCCAQRRDRAFSGLYSQRQSDRRKLYRSYAILFLQIGLRSLCPQHTVNALNCAVLRQQRRRRDWDMRGRGYGRPCMRRRGEEHNQVVCYLSAQEHLWPAACRPTGSDDC
jgi:hypothetical protein